jgi:hypothetical protein
MAKNLWDRERNDIFKDLTRQYEEEGYSLKVMTCLNNYVEIIY